eukprot:gene20204-24186_t
MVWKCFATVLRQFPELLRLLRYARLSDHLAPLLSEAGALPEGGKNALRQERMGELWTHLRVPKCRAGCVEALLRDKCMGALQELQHQHQALRATLEAWQREQQDPGQYMGSLHRWHGDDPKKSWLMDDARHLLGDADKLWGECSGRSGSEVPPPPGQPEQLTVESHPGTPLVVNLGSLVTPPVRSGRASAGLHDSLSPPRLDRLSPAGTLSDVEEETAPPVHWPTLPQVMELAMSNTMDRHRGRQAGPRREELEDKSTPHGPPAPPPLTLPTSTQHRLGAILGTEVTDVATPMATATPAVTPRVNLRQSTAQFCHALLELAPFFQRTAAYWVSCLEKCEKREMHMLLKEHSKLKTASTQQPTVWKGRHCEARRLLRVMAGVEDRLWAATCGLQRARLGLVAQHAAIEDAHAALQYQAQQRQLAEVQRLKEEREREEASKKSELRSKWRVGAQKATPSDPVDEESDDSGDEWDEDVLDNEMEECLLEIVESMGLDVEDVFEEDELLPLEQRTAGRVLVAMARLEAVKRVSQLLSERMGRRTFMKHRKMNHLKHHGERRKDSRKSSVLLPLKHFVEEHTGSSNSMDIEGLAFQLMNTTIIEAISILMSLSMSDAAAVIASVPTSLAVDMFNKIAPVVTARILSHMEAERLATLLAALPEERRKLVLEKYREDGLDIGSLTAEVRVAMLVELPLEEQIALLASMSTSSLLAHLEHLDPNEAAELLGMLNEDVVTSVLALMSTSERGGSIMESVAFDETLMARAGKAAADEGSVGLQRELLQMRNKVVYMKAGAAASTLEELGRSGK